MNYTNRVNNTSFFLKLKLLGQLLSQRLQIIVKTKKQAEISNSFSLIIDFLKRSFSPAEKLFVLVLICALVWFLVQIGGFFSFSAIDKTLQNQQSAKAEGLIKNKMTFTPNDKSLKLRLAHAYLGLGRQEEAKAIIQEIQNQDPYNNYLPKVAIALSENLKRENQAEQAINILEKLPLSGCANCKQTLLELYSLEGRKALMERNLERATFFLGKALILSEKLHESNSSIGHRKRQLAQAYNLQAAELIKAKEENRAIQVLEKAGETYPNGQTYLNLGKLYAQNLAQIENIKKGLTYYEKAYSFGQTEPETVLAYNQLLRSLKTKMRSEGVSAEEIEKTLKSFSLPQTTALAIRETKTNLIKENKPEEPDSEPQQTNNSKTANSSSAHLHREDSAIKQTETETEKPEPIQEPLLEEEPTDNE